MSQPDKIVSSDLEDIILVNELDENIGTMSKRACHEQDGQLHRAFSVFIFNSAGDVLLQKRSDQKLLWPMHWSNACCSHPRVDETSEVAVHRRLQQELGIKTELTFLYKFQYHARYGNVGSENELCWVWVGKAEVEDVQPNTNEIAEWRFFSREYLNHELEARPEVYTPWMKMEWQRIFEDHSAQLP